MTHPKITFTPATKRAAKGRIALEGPSGAGKTYTALTLAAGLGTTTAVIDTEHGSASKYADLFTFDALALDSFDPALLIEALTVAGAAGYDTVIVDSLSHFWMGTDGMLEQVDRAAKKSASGNTFAGWKTMRPTERRMVDALLAYPGHVIATMRTKSEWVIEDNDRGKKAPKKIGTKAEQREGMEYEFDIVGSMSIDNELMVTKTRCPALAGAVIPRPGAALAATLRDWLQDGVPAGDPAGVLRDRALADATVDELRDLYREAASRALLGAPVTDPAGAETTLGDLLRSLATPPAPTRAPVEITATDWPTTAAPPTT